MIQRAASRNRFPDGTSNPQETRGSHFMKNRGQSIFRKREVPLVQGNQPLLYPQCHTVNDVLLDSTPFLDPLKAALGLPQGFVMNKKRKISDFLVTSQLLQGTNTKAAHEPCTDILADHSVPTWHSQGNAEEARELRNIMGLEKTDNHKPAGFAFGFEGGSPAVRDHSDDKECLSVFVGGMPYTWTKDEVHDFWAECGSIVDIDCMTFRDTGRFKGIARITYATREGYDAALKCDGETWDGFSFVVTKWKQKERLVVSSAAAIAPKKSQPLTHEPIGKKIDGFDVLFMCNIPSSMKQEEIAELFEEFHIEAVKLKTDPETGKSKGYAQIHFGRADDCLETAIQKLDQSQVRGRTVRLGYAIPPPNWKPKKHKAFEAGRRNTTETTIDDFRTTDGRFLIRVSGFLPSVTEHNVRRLFSKASLQDVLLVWSIKKQRNTGAVYLIVSDIESVKQILDKNDIFHQGRRLHTRPGKFTDYLQKKARSRRKRKAPFNAPTTFEASISGDDPLMALL